MATTCNMCDRDRLLAEAYTASMPQSDVEQVAEAMTYGLMIATLDYSSL